MPRPAERRVRTAYHKLAVDIRLCLSYFYFIILVVGTQCVVQQHGGFPVATILMIGVVWAFVAEVFRMIRALARLVVGREC